MTLKVNDPSAEYTAGQGDRDLIDALMGGTAAMRAVGEKYLPRFEMECPEDYKKRLACATLYPAFSETVKNMTGRVFYRPINRDEVADDLKGDIENIDLQGNDLDVFAASWFSSGLAYGLCHALVDYPKTAGLSSRADGVLTLQDAKAANLRPYARLVRPHDLIGWIVEIQNNVSTLVQARIRETATVRDGAYGAKLVNRVRVLEPGRFEVWEEPEDSRKADWTLVDEGQTSISSIPLVTFYSGRTGMLQAKSPLLELAHLNIKHWQEQSDQDASVRFARIRIVYAAGIDGEAKISASAESVVQLPAGASMGVVQGSAESVKVGSDSLAALEDQMREAGAKLLVKSSQATKAVAQAKSDAIVEQSALGAMAQGLEDAIDQVLQIMAEFRGIDDGGHADVNDDFDALDDQAAGVDGLTKLVASEIISEETAFNECKRRGVISNELDWQAEQERINSGAVNGVPV
ncbi:MAG: DUF4055 domain-containing protein [Rhodanobacter sp.]|uniref:DUF4055 domain-containing protein n=1 Tax=Castellaniella sp. TaxID=1955812 RepID=UPI003C7683DE